MIKTDKKNVITHFTTDEYETYYNKFFGYYESDSDEERLGNDTNKGNNSVLHLDDDANQSDSDDNSLYDSEAYNIEENDFIDNPSDIENSLPDSALDTLLLKMKVKNKLQELVYESYSPDSD